jgi:hypothetical protein
MKNIFRDSLGKFKSLKINLLDGQRRGEIVFRRVFLLVIVYVLVVLVGKLITNKPQEAYEVEEVDAGYTYTQEEYPELYEVPEAEVVEVVETGGKGLVIEEKDSVKEYIKSYGGKIDDDYLALLRKYCDEETLKVVVAISVAESSMGKNTSKQSNYFGWFKGNNRSYDPIREEMAQEICRGIGTYYRNIGFDRNLTMRYTGGDRVETWTGNFMSAIESM